MSLWILQIFLRMCCCPSLFKLDQLHAVSFKYLFVQLNK